MEPLSPAAGPPPSGESADAPRRGRPRVQEAADEIVASVLATAGPRVGTRDLSTRRIALLTGLSQPVVSRAVSRIRGSSRAEGPPGEARAMRLVEFRVEFPRIVIVVEPGGEAPAGQAQSFARRAAALMAALRVSGAREWPSEAAPPVEEVALPAGRLRLVWEPWAQPWEEFLARVSAALDACAPADDSIPGDLLSRVAARVGRGLLGVRWHRRDAAAPGRAWQEIEETFESKTMTVPEFPAPRRGRSGGSRWLPQDELSITEQIAIALRKEIMNAGFHPGDRLSPAVLASRLGLTLPTVRAAMRRLVDDGLLAVDAGHFAVPEVTGQDVVDLYASRLHVGSVLLRGCAAQPRHRLLASRLALRAVEAAAAEGTSADVDQADLHFQQELADASGLSQSARTFHALTLRVRMFISVLQLDYSPAVDRIVADDRRILSALLENRPDDAVAQWRAKLDNAVRHMTALSPTSFDRDLWGRLTTWS
ncbi:GntR family transcriptional regulator [Rothia sp. AR01]|uniref:GntR family transcriptional regulator n=1 Tax=Rothia santali TaxID=2949643 RepID=A0A9X2KH03_9MICC|nr:GntR family transcriptional regulator [Rothia santali]MCP3424688.1 GntR family transcriptional regulator [Rothia santali]